MPHADVLHIDPDQTGDFSSMLERGHYVAGEPAELLLKLRGGKAFCPMDAKIFQPRVFCLDGLDAVDHLLSRSAKPGLLFQAIAKGGNARRRAACTPGAAMLIRVTCH